MTFQFSGMHFCFISCLVFIADETNKLVKLALTINVSRVFEQLHQVANIDAVNFDTISA